MISRYLGFALLAALASACGGGDDGPDLFAVYPDQVYTGFETGAGAVTYKVPLVASDKSATFSVESGSEAVFSIDDKGNGEAELTALGPGVGRINVEGPDGPRGVNVTVTLYQVADRLAGETAYKAAMPDCGKCHDADRGGKDDNTSSAIAEHPDEAVLLNIKTGNDPDGDEIRDFHKFTTVPNGVVAYLRSLPARQKPGPDL